MEPRSYRSPEAFRTALEQRIRKAVAGGGMNRFRQLLVFDRFLTRAFQHFGERVILKGGLVLELRLDRARTTNDVDLRLVGDSRDLLRGGRPQQSGCTQFPKAVPQPLGHERAGRRRLPGLTLS